MRINLYAALRAASDVTLIDTASSSGNPDAVPGQFRCAVFLPDERRCAVDNWAILEFDEDGANMQFQFRDQVIEVDPSTGRCQVEDDFDGTYTLILEKRRPISVLDVVSAVTAAIAG